jgi:phosphotransferase system  glucose/maltose/N-acetylglucosamine-specific IIC component
MKWIVDNYLVLISGLAVPAIYGMLNKFFFKRNDTKQINQKQKSGKNSINIQVGGNVDLDKKDD